MPRLLTACVLFLPCLLRQDEMNVVVETSDGSRLVGTAPFGRIVVEGELGELKFEPAKVQSITFGETDTVTAGAATVKGRVKIEKVVLTMSEGIRTLDRDKIKAITFKGVAKAGAGEPSAPAVGDGVLKPAATVQVTSTLSRMILSPDRAALFALNATEGRLLRIDAAKGTIAARLELAEGAEAMCLAPDGKTLFISVSVNGHQHNSSAQKPQAGKIQIVDTTAFTVRETVTLDYDPVDIDTDGKYLYLAPGSDQSGPIAVVDIAKKQIVAKWGRASTTGILRVNPEGGRLYHTSVAGSSPIYDAYLFPKDLKEKPETYTSINGKSPAGGAFGLTPDGRYLVSNTGAVLRLTKSRADDLRLATKIEEHVAVAMDKGCQSLFLATKDGFLRRYSLPDFVLRQTWHTGLVAYRMAIDASNRRLFLAFDMKKEVNGYYPTGTGDIAIFSLPAWTDPDGRVAVEPKADAPGVDANVFKPEVRKGQKCPLCYGKKVLSLEEESNGNVITYETRCCGCVGKGTVDIEQCRTCRGSGKAYYSGTVIVGGSAVFVSDSVPCERCDAGGWVVRSPFEEAIKAGKEKIDCLVCAGTKKFSYKVKEGGKTKTVSSDCDCCHATGKLKASKCATCLGGGTEYVTKTLVLNGKAATMSVSIPCRGCRGTGVSVAPVE